jgi:metal-responsive CopG/Arc/MetJ family transcriptional regulator
MQKEKRLKTKRIYVRIEDDVYNALDEYVKENSVTKTKLIDDFLRELLKDKLKD